MIILLLPAILLLILVLCWHPRGGDVPSDPMPLEPAPDCGGCAECQRRDAALYVDTGRYPGIPPRRADVTWATDPTVYEG